MDTQEHKRANKESHKRISPLAAGAAVSVIVFSMVGVAAMTVLGAAGGAYAGNEIEKNVKKHYSYRVTVRMDDGTYRTISQTSPPTVAVGAKVRVTDGVLVARG